jgi:hypothetical protein
MMKNFVSLFTKVGYVFVLVCALMGASLASAQDVNNVWEGYVVTVASNNIMLSDEAVIASDKEGQELLGKVCFDNSSSASVWEIEQNKENFSLLAAACANGAKVGVYGVDALAGRPDYINRVYTIRVEKPSDDLAAIKTVLSDIERIVRRTKRVVLKILGLLEN